MLAALPRLRHPPWPAEIEPGPDDFRPGAPPTTLGQIRSAWASALQDCDQQWPYSRLFRYGARGATVARFAADSREQIPTTARLGPGDFENDADALLLQGRCVILGLALGLAALVFVWARTLFGPFWGTTHSRPPT